MKYLDTSQIQTALLALLETLAAVFEDHGIRYSLDGGTLLGAVRHKGFIPWDDDIDVIVPRPDFDNLCAHPEWAPNGFEFAVPANDGYIMPFIKFFDLEWRAQEAVLSGSLEEYLWIDVFPADAVPDSPLERKRLFETQAKLVQIANLSYVNIKEATVRSKSTFKRILKPIALPICKAIFPAERGFQRVIQRAASRQFGSTEGVWNIVWGFNSKNILTLPANDFDNLIDLPFEDCTFKAVPHWDLYLTGLYGDYMQLPPENQRVTHGIKVWRNMER